MGEPSAAEATLPHALLGMTVVTGVVDAVSFLALGHVFTANMTGNVVFLAFATTGVPAVSVTRSLTALALFMLGAAAGGRIMAAASPATQLRVALRIFALEVVLVGAAALVAIGHQPDTPDTARVYALIALTALAMGMQTAAVRKLGVPDLTTTVLTLTIAGLAADSSLAGGGNPRWQRRIASVLAMFAGAAIGAFALERSVAAALLVAVAGLSCACLAVALSVRRAARLTPAS